MTGIASRLSAYFLSSALCRAKYLPFHRVHSICKRTFNVRFISARVKVITVHVSHSLSLRCIKPDCAKRGLW